MCFALQRRALFRHRKFQKWTDNEIFYLFWFLKYVSRYNGVHFFDIVISKSAPTMMNFEDSIWICALRHNGMHFFDIVISKSAPTMIYFAHLNLEMCFAPQRVQFFISPLASWLRTRRFSEPTFRSSGAPNHWKNIVNRDFPMSSRISIFFLLTVSLLFFFLLIFLFSLSLPCSAFHLSILSEIWFLNFLRLM